MLELHDDYVPFTLGPEESDTETDAPNRDFSFDSGYCSSTPNKLPGYTGLLDSSRKTVLSIVKEEVVDRDCSDPFISQIKQAFSPLTSRRVDVESNNGLPSLRLDDWEACLGETFEEKLFNLDDLSSPLSAKKQHNLYTCRHTTPVTQVTRHVPITPSSNSSSSVRLKKKLLFSPEGRLKSPRSPQTFMRLSPIKTTEANRVLLQENFTCSRSIYDMNYVVPLAPIPTGEVLNCARLQFKKVLRCSVNKAREEYIKHKENTDIITTEADKIMAEFTVKPNTTTRKRKYSQKLKQDSLIVVRKEPKLPKVKSAKSLLLSQSSAQYVNIRPKPQLWTLHRV